MSVHKIEEKFQWSIFDSLPYLPANWQEELIKFTLSNMRLYAISPTNETSRETDLSVKIPTLAVSGGIIKRQLPWLYEFYEGAGLRMMQDFYVAEKLICAQNPLYAVNIQAAYDVDSRGNPMRYERHVDWAPTSLLYATTHPPGTGGELVVANNPSARGDEIAQDCIKIHPHTGQLICIDARKYPHYVEPLKPRDPSFVQERPLRVVVVMLYCTGPEGSCPESSRPSALDRHLGHEPEMV
ncbi:MAG: hypothetical protein SFW62_07115 [Alphaproteobacteria bacterium]|nr:hypothetical protein [Alphaproteobacteria bacterium]